MDNKYDTTNPLTSQRIIRERSNVNQGDTNFSNSNKLLDEGLGQ